MNPARSFRRLYSVRCRRCGLQITRSERLMPWKACSEDCAHELWFQHELRTQRN
jgi:hypothetical protein